mmetsp:Transcript_103196/g.266799  ORF Transcript_103196/g.266799 Transcript_103196/m.266799 type:complete len:232 (-) Transcript_103196:952-1647(-)
MNRTELNRSLLGARGGEPRLPNCAVRRPDSGAGCQTPPVEGGQAQATSISLSSASLSSGASPSASRSSTLPLHCRWKSVPPSVATFCPTTSWSRSSFSRLLSFVALDAIMWSVAMPRSLLVEMPVRPPFSSWCLAMTSTSSRWLRVRLRSTRPRLALAALVFVASGSDQMGRPSRWRACASASWPSRVCTSSTQKLKSFKQPGCQLKDAQMLSTEATRCTPGAAARPASAA